MYGRESARIKPAVSAIWVVTLILLCAVAAEAQLTLGENVNMNMSGSLGYGYNGSFGNHEIGSSHSSGFTGDGNLTGYYFHPNFLTFNFRPYYQRNQTNTDSQVITSGTGFGGSLGLFGGSRFPGSISFGQDFSTNSQFRLAGVDTLSADSSGRNFAISWSALIPDLPRLSVTYAKGVSKADFLGTSSSDNHSSNLNLNSSYRAYGFDMQAFFSRSANDFTTPSILFGEEISSHTSSISYGASTQHSLPLRGSFSLNWAHSDLESSGSSDFSTNSYTAGTSISPTRRLSLYQSASYTSNLLAAYAQSVLNGANVAELYNYDQDSHGLFYTTGANYQLGYGINISGHFNHRVQWFAGERNEDSQYGGAISFNKTSQLFGVLYLGIGIVNTASELGNEGGGLTGNVGFSKRIGKWEAAADFNYGQNVQTLMGITTTSSYGYGGSLRRRVNKELSFGGAARASHSGITSREGDSNRAESVSGFVAFRRYSIASSYSQSSGTAVLTSTGELTTTPLGSIFTPEFLLFNARSFGINGSTRLFRRVSVSGGYSQFTSSTEQGPDGTLNTGSRYSVQMDYRLRKFSIVGGYAHSNQDVSRIPGGPRVVNSYYVSLSRWFNVF